MDLFANTFDENHFNSVNLDFYSLMDYNNNNLESDLNSITLFPQIDCKPNEVSVKNSIESIPQKFDKKVFPTNNKSIEEVFASTPELTELSIKECPKTYRQITSHEVSTETTDYHKSGAVEVPHECSHYYDEHSLPVNFTKDLKKIKRIGKKLCLLSGKNGPFSEKKLAHATAESRYRSSINEQIKRLKTLVAGPNANWKKSAILETVAEYIQQLKSANAKLIEENLQLKMKLSQSAAHMRAPAHSYVFVPTIPSLSTTPQVSTLMYSCI